MRSQKNIGYSSAQVSEMLALAKLLTTNAIVSRNRAF
jgi:hypothetical protein